MSTVRLMFAGLNRHQQSVPEDPHLTLGTKAAEPERTHLSKAAVIRAFQPPPQLLYTPNGPFPSPPSLLFFLPTKPQIVSRFSHIVT